ncbi:hypothetical protein HK097_008082 [Rhizophlyctis rosea]|uniref:Uncharacterized protein n=1 Tax=Rhizophlyctis rosea TaxID=64517 RepID=A0AAD5SDX7_9FUNG|nr:hypothetical protein HK097_008082 [Rhizophlyctis rosea]
MSYIPDFNRGGPRELRGRDDIRPLVQDAIRRAGFKCGKISWKMMKEFRSGFALIGWPPFYEYGKDPKEATATDAKSFEIYSHLLKCVPLDDNFHWDQCLAEPLPEDPLNDGKTPLRKIIEYYPAALKHNRGKENQPVTRRRVPEYDFTVRTDFAKAEEVRTVVLSTQCEEYAKTEPTHNEESPTVVAKIESPERTSDVVMEFDSDVETSAPS